MKRTAPPSGYIWDLKDLANLSNMTTANAIRTLTDFGNERIIVVDGRTIKIIDEKTLVKISRFG